MVQVCPNCNSEARDIAKFCDQCATPLTPDAVPAVQAVATGEASIAPAARPLPSFNWTGLVFIVLIMVAIGWVIFQKPTRNQVQLGVTTGGGANAGEANPMDTMANVMERLEVLKSDLAGDPLNSNALNEMYSLYGQIGQQEKVRPYLDAGLKAVREQHASGALDTEAATKKLAELALAALQGQDNEGAVSALSLYHEIEPQNLGVIATIGNLYYDMERHADSIEWYDKYLTATTPAAQGEDYYNVATDRAYMLFRQGEQDAAKRAEAIGELREITEAQPELWNAWYILGEALLADGDKAAAREAYLRAVEVAGDSTEKWQAEVRIAEIDGKQPPPAPNPHADGSIPLPPGDGAHGGMSMPPEGTPNPHGEGF